MVKFVLQQWIYLTVMQIEDRSMWLDSSELFELVDLDRSGEIDMNEFCEAFRLSRDSVMQVDQG